MRADVGAVKGNQTEFFTPQRWFPRYHCTWEFFPMNQILSSGLVEDNEEQQKESESWNKIKHKPQD